MNALESLFNGSLTGAREQTVLTPPWLTDNLRREWGAILMDACAEASPGNVPALLWITKEMDGLSIPWLPQTYANPEFNHLKLWLAHAQKQPGPTALLSPVRTHRKWYRAAARTCSAIIEFDPFAFVGFDCTFPAPLALLCWGWTPRDEVWADRGDVRHLHA